MVMKLTLLSIVLAACLVNAAPAIYKDAVGASSAALTIDKNLAKREGTSIVGVAVNDEEETQGGAAEATFQKRYSGKTGATVDKALIIEVAKRGAI